MFYDPLFDLNRDGRIDAAEWAFMDEMLNPTSMDEYDDEIEDELDMAGLDYDDLSMMDEDEPREALEDAGLDPDDYYDEF